jgi:hypothetical protein
MSESPAQEARTRTALVLYGSETGNAQEVAEELGALAERLHFVTHVAEMNSVKAVRVQAIPFPCGRPYLQFCRRRCSGRLPLRYLLCRLRARVRSLRMRGRFGGRCF